LPGLHGDALQEFTASPMAQITAIFSDVGGVLLTNGWDRHSRRRLVEEFKLDWDEFEDRHELVATAFDTGHLDLALYLDRTIFYRPRDFAVDEIKKFMLAESRPFEDSLALLARLAANRKYFLAALNNESRELNLHRIERFGLRKYFTVFFSSCFLGVKKPDREIYVKALEMSQRAPEECVFVDDRGLNLECAARLGMRTIQFQDAKQLERDLRTLGVDF
jgi:putative hydrolase of the HAD superfamily